MTTEPPLRDRIPDLPDAARALLLAADIVEYGDLHELAIPFAEVQRFGHDEEAMLRTIIGHVLRQLAAGGLPPNVTHYNDVSMPWHLKRPQYALGAAVRAAGSNDAGEVVARTYNVEHGWLYDVHREGMTGGAPWVEEATLLPKDADLPPGILWVEDCPECTPVDPTVTFSQRNRCDTCESGKVYLPEPSNPAVKSALWALGEVKVAKALALARAEALLAMLGG